MSDTTNNSGKPKEPMPEEAEKNTAAKRAVKRPADRAAKSQRSDDRTASTLSKAAGPAPKPADAAPKATATSDDSRPKSVDKKSSLVLLLVLIVVLALLGAGLFWYQYHNTNQRLHTIEQQINSTIEQGRQMQGAQQLAQQALDASASQKRELEQQAKSLQEARRELQGLNEAFQLITDRGSDLVLLNDIDHLITIAQQQLQLAGNVANAIISLETAQAQLARANRPAFAALQQTINGDLERLRAASTVDIALVSERLEELAGLVSEAPLTVPDDASTIAGTRVQPQKPSEPSDGGANNGGASHEPWWPNVIARAQDWTRSSWTSLQEEFSKLISVHRVDDANALLISPDQAGRFRDNLRLRIMTAQLALMMGQAEIWASETSALAQAVDGRFDQRSALSRKALKIARDLADTRIDAALPDVNNSMKALEAQREQYASESSATRATEGLQDIERQTPASTSDQD